MKPTNNFKFITLLFMCLTLFSNSVFADVCLLSRLDSTVEAYIASTSPSNYSESGLRQFGLDNGFTDVTGSLISAAISKVVNVSNGTTTYTFDVSAYCQPHNTREYYTTKKIVSNSPTSIPTPSLSIYQYGSSPKLDITSTSSYLFQVAKDDNTTDLIYEGYDSSLVDTSSSIKPNNPTVDSAVTLASTVEFKFSATSKTETHMYKVRSKTSDNRYSDWSSNVSVTLSSAPRGYAIKVDKSPLTDPGKTMNNTSGTMSVGNYREGDIIYCHVRTVDTNNQWSDPIHYKYIVKQTAADLKEECSAFAKKLVVDNKSDIASVQAQVTKLRTNTNIPYVVNKVGRTNATKYTKGKVQVTITVDGQSQSSTAPINCKPIYQTEQELKEDITDYIGQTNIHTNSKQLPETLSYSKSQDIDAVKEDIITKCKTNPSLKDIEISFKNTATEFKSGKLEGEIYLKD